MVGVSVCLCVSTVLNRLNQSTCRVFRSWTPAGQTNHVFGRPSQGNGQFRGHSPAGSLWREPVLSSGFEFRCQHGSICLYLWTLAASLFWYDWQSDFDCRRNYTVFCWFHFVAIAHTVVIRHDTIRDAILTCARKPTWFGLFYRTEPTTKNCKTEKLKSKNMYVRSNSKSLGNHM